MMARPARGVWTALALLLYLAALNVRRDTVPAGLNNDAAEEALRGVYLVQNARFEALNLEAANPEHVPFGNSAETLFLYVLGLAAQILGTTPLAVHLATWLFALGVLALLPALVRRIDPAIPPWIPLLLGATSVWLFHYARSGYRANTAPLFLVLVALLLDRAESAPGPAIAPAVAVGAVLGLSLYGYTSCRILAIAWVVHGALNLARAGTERYLRARRYAAALGAFLLVSLPNLVLLARQPDEFLLRGAYVVRGGAGALAANIARTLVLPLHYPGYRTAVGPEHRFDGVSVSLTAAGVQPIPLLVGIAAAAGAALGWKRRREPVVSYLLACWGTAILALGISGPSLTRLLVILPAILTFAAIAAGRALALRGGRAVVAAILALLAAHAAREYFVVYARSPSSRLEYGYAATPAGLRARALAERGSRVLCVVSRDANVVHYLTHDVRQRVRVVEFWERAADPRQIPLASFRPDVVLVDRAAALEPLRAALARAAPPRGEPEYEEFLLADKGP